LSSFSSRGYDVERACRPATRNRVDQLVGFGDRAGVQRVVVLGRGGAGKSTLAVRLGAITGLPVVELDAHFWGPDLTPLPPERWVALQRDLVRPESWILDGDLGPYDDLDVRLGAADTVVLLDFSLVRCAWRAVRRSREGWEFWWWVGSYRRRWRPLVLAAVARSAPGADLRVLRTPRSVRRFVAHVAEAQSGPSTDGAM
jgi:hypothetical protein